MNGIYAGKQMASERSAYPSEDAAAGQYRQAFDHALRPRDRLTAAPNTMPVLIEAASINASDVVSIHSRLARIAGALGRHIPMKNDPAQPTSAPMSMLDQFGTINSVQRDAIDGGNRLLMEIEQALGL